jgi:hypothetical protein
MNTNTTTKKQVAIVTGASSGMGLGITQALPQRGYRVVANSCNISKSKDLKPSSDLILVDGDIGKMDTAIKVADAAIKHFDRIDLLVNAAGIYIPKQFTDYTPADFEGGLFLPLSYISSSTNNTIWFEIEIIDSLHLAESSSRCLSLIKVVEQSGVPAYLGRR